MVSDSFVVWGDDFAAFFGRVLDHLDERQRRLVAGATGLMLGEGGITTVAKIAGMSRSTVTTGVRQIRAGVEPSGRVRDAGAGRPSLLDLDPDLLMDLDSLVEPTVRGDPMSPLRWTIKSVRSLAGELQRLGHEVEKSSIGPLLKMLGYTLQSASKQKSDNQHVDRNGQFRHINDTAKDHLDAGEPVISIDTKKKELVGDYCNGGQDYRPKGDPTLVDAHDFPGPDVAKAIPFGVYDIGRNQGWVSVRDDHDTAQFAVETIRRWWNTIDSVAYPAATRLAICADAGGSNGYRSLLWKVELASLVLRTFEWVQRHENVSICGPSGTGKSHFLEALGHAAIDHGHTVAWFTLETLGTLVRAHRPDNTITKQIIKLCRKDIICIDDIGLLPVSKDAAEGFYRIVDAAYEKRSIIVSSNLHPSGFDELMPKTLATATVDRLLLHHNHRGVVGVSPS